jgi:hypothetical protein
MLEGYWNNDNVLVKSGTPSHGLHTHFTLRMVTLMHFLTTQEVAYLARYPFGTCRVPL